MNDIHKGDSLDVVIEKVEGKGKAIARIGQFVIFVDKGIPGQKVRVMVKKKKERYAETVFMELLEESPDAIPATCSWFGKCGGCVWQTMEYEEQLKIKHSIVSEAIKHVGKVEEDLVLPVIESPNRWNYRNKIELSFGENDLGETDLGFRKKGSYTAVLPVDVCHIFSEKFPAVIEVIREWVKNSGKDYFDLKKSPKGFFQYCMIRKAEYKDQWLFNFITREGDLPNLEELVASLEEVLAESFVSLYHTVNLGGVGYAHHSKKNAECLYGKEQIIEKLEDLKFLVSPFSFFQTNTKGAEILYSVVREFADLKEGDVLIDLYCGTGTIGQFVAKGMDVEIHGIEIVPEAIADAIKNAKMNDISNVKYFCGDARRILKEKADEYNDMSGVTIVDPPRSGLSPKALQRSLDIGMDRLVYVSCNPITFARDVVFIHENSDYVLKKVQPVDMFPQTSHVELVSLFEKKVK